MHEGMEAGLAESSIQRLGPNSVQADFDDTPMSQPHRRALESPVHSV
jgi:hypothetical protein